MKKFLTIDDLIEFCMKNNFSKFSSKESNAEISVQMPAVATFGKSDDNKHTEGLCPFNATAYHDHVNLNKSNINEDTFKENTQSIPYRPILANIVENSDGNKDFGSHDFTVETDENGEEKITYQERPVGVIKKDYAIEYDKEAGVNRAVIQGYLWEGYCQDAIDIMQRRQQVDCSVELSIRELSFNAKDKVLNLDDYYVSGLTLLNENVGPGMAGSNVQLADFESKVGLKVFDRTTRQLMLTPFGTALLPYINDMLDRNEQLNNFIADYKHEKRGRVTIYAPTGIITYLSKHVIDKIKDIGDITLSLKTCNLERNAFYEGVEFPDDCDVLISYAPPKDESLVASFITQYAVTAYASQRYLEKHPISRPDELEHHSCILIDSMMIDDANIWRFNVAGSKEVRDYRVKGNYVCDNTQSALELARNHLGIVFAPDKSVQSDLQDGTLVPCFQQPYEWWLDLVAIFRKREYQPWRVQYVLDEMLREIRHQLAQSQQLRPEQAAESED